MLGGSAEVNNDDSVENEIYPPDEVNDSENESVNTTLYTPPSISTILSSLRAASLTLRARLLSIDLDCKFVSSVASFYSLDSFEVVANLRCGAFYTDSPTKAYFKSTDGHIHNWAFSLRRSNFGILKCLAEVPGKKGLIIVDSTRRGKSFPDSLSKTVPIWCAVINRALYLRFLTQDDVKPPDTPAKKSATWIDYGVEPRLVVPDGGVISDSEKSQIEKRIDGWAKQLLSSQLIIPDLKLPLKPIHICPTSTLPTLPSDLPFHPIICLSSSMVQSTHDRHQGWEYTPGAGDDEESWSQGLTPALFWKNHRKIIDACMKGDGPALEVVKEIVDSQSCQVNSDSTGSSTLIHPTTGVYLVSGMSSYTQSPTLLSVHLHPQQFTPPLPPHPRTVHLTLPAAGKKGKGVFPLLPLVVQQLEALMDKFPDWTSIDVVDESGEGKDESVAITLVLLLKYFSADGTKLEPSSAPPPKITKSSIATRLQWVLNAKPDVNPSRAALKAVNTFLMSGAYAS